MIYQELTYWSPIYGAECSRISVVDANGSEFFAMLPKTDGRAYTTLRQKAVEKLSEAIEMGIEPGEIRWR